MSTGLLKIKHTDGQRKKDRHEFWAWMEWAREKIQEEIKSGRVRPEPGDMSYRGIWKTEGSMMYTPYSQLSCAIGQAVVNSVADLEKLSELTEELGKSFIFSAVKSVLKKHIEANPTKFSVLLIQEGWMDNAEVMLVSTRP